MKRKIIWGIVMILVIIGGILFFFRGESEEENEIKKVGDKASTDMHIVTSLEDKITDNTAWCGTFNLIWNDLKNDLAKQDIIFENQSEIVDNLNKGTFNTSYLSENSYYKVYGVPSLALKAEIEKAIREKFNETSDILDDFDWSNGDLKDYFLYAMLKKEFEFPTIFTELEDGKFGNYENVKYFGIDESSDKEVRNQVEILYYDSKEDFAIKLLTKSDDEVILVKGAKEDTFGNIYEEIIKKDELYEGNHNLTEGERLQIPNIKFDLKEEINEVENNVFSFANGDEYVIEKALQTIQFELDKKGGKIKSEAGMMVKDAALVMEGEPREFLIDDTFSIFLIEEGKELPYFAAKISDITTVQKEANPTDIALESENDFELKFMDKRYESQSKIRTALKKTETDT